MKTDTIRVRFEFRYRDFEFADKAVATYQVETKTEGKRRWEDRGFIGKWKGQWHASRDLIPALEAQSGPKAGTMDRMLTQVGIALRKEAEAAAAPAA